jgi:hypothetical protein
LLCDTYKGVGKNKNANPLVSMFILLA